MSHPPSRPKDTSNRFKPASELPEDLREMLQSDPLFANLEAWTFQPVRGGLISPHTYRMVSAGRDYFVKAITPNEKYTLQLLHQTGVSLAPAIYSVPLLERGCLVTDFIYGDQLSVKRLQPSLIGEVARMQNALNDRTLFEGSTTPSGCKYNDHDDGFYRQALMRNFQAGRELLQALSDAYHLPIVDQFRRLADWLEANLDSLVETYSGMPFAWLHNDFREDNILGDPQRLVDWGSSYGHGPFLVDLAPFLADDPEGLQLFTGESDIGRSADGEAMKRWLMAALGARLVGFIRWRIGLDSGNVDTREACRGFLECEFTPFRHLSGYKF